ncbi:MAG: heavy metal translocating P-type ATPase, partial [Pirellulaceae bacterium]
VALHDVQVGDILRVLPGERVPVDGIIRRNHAAIDEQIVTGESQPAIKEPGDAVLAGTLNLDGDLLIQVTCDPRQGTLQRLVDAVCRAAMSRSQLQRAADRISSVFLPSVIAVALLTFGWHAYRHGAEQGVLTGLAVLLIACPCALGIATPIATWVAMGRAARAGVLFRHGDTLQRLAQVRAVFLDKTGTLTTGDSDVVAFATDGDFEQELVAGAAWHLASASTHGLSCAVQRYVRDLRGVTVPSVPSSLPGDLRTLPGRGLSAWVEGIDHRVFLGSPRLMEESGLRAQGELAEKIHAYQRDGRPLTCIGWGQRIRGVFAFREQLRNETAGAIAELRSLGLEVSVLTGDQAARAGVLAQLLNVPIASGLLPEEKAARVEAVRRQQGAVAMVGDGINDAPALAAADVGIALGCGADVSRDAAQVCLLGNDLRRVAWSIRLARQTVHTIYLNLFWAFLYNVLGIAIAATGWLNPIWAAAAMVVSSLFVLSNSLRLSLDSASSETVSLAAGMVPLASGDAG